MRVHRLVGWISFALALSAAPAASAAPCAGFIDVQDADPFCTHIAWMKNRAITLGCTANQYCPTLFVTRDQMAAFMYRLGFQNAFLQGGNAFGTTATLGTTDDYPLLFKASNMFVLGLVPSTNSNYGFSPNLVGGHPNNSATCPGICVAEPPVGATVAGGGSASAANSVTDSFGFVGGGRGNIAGNDNADNVDARSATVSGGETNVASGAFSTIGGGDLNVASLARATVAGGRNNQAAGFASSIGGGQNNQTSNQDATIVGGFGNLASGPRSTVVGGYENEAAGSYSLAAGNRAKAYYNGCLVWGDATIGDIACSGPNQFVARTTGGVFIYSGVAANLAGVYLLPGASSWSMLSDSATKENVEPIDAEATLARLAAMPISTWNYVAQSPDIRHVGPMAQDFRAAFGFGEDERLISTIDAQGVALAAIQGLNRKLEQKIATLEAALQELAAELRALKNAQRE